jgi:hypothetical protein
VLDGAASAARTAAGGGGMSMPVLWRFVMAAEAATSMRVTARSRKLSN